MRASFVGSVSMRSNNRFEFAPCGRPTRKGEALLLAAQAERYIT
jgi:hypothetical protein